MSIPTKAQVDALQAAAVTKLSASYTPTRQPVYGTSITVTPVSGPTAQLSFEKVDRGRFGLVVDRDPDGSPSSRPYPRITVFDRLGTTPSTNVCAISFDQRVYATNAGDLQGIVYVQGPASGSTNLQADCRPGLTFTTIQEFIDTLIDFFRLSEGIGVDLLLGPNESGRFDYEALAETDPDGRVFLKDFSGNPIDWNAIAPLTSHGIEWVDDEYIYHTANITYRDPDGLYVFLENNEKPPGVIRINR